MSNVTSDAAAGDRTTDDPTPGEAEKLSTGLHCRGISLSIGREEILRDVDLSIESGRALVLLGSSGAGKTSVLRVIAGLQEAAAGTVRLDGRVLSDPEILVPPEDRGVGVVFQALELWAHMSVAEHIGFGLPRRPTGWSARRNRTVRDLAEQVGLPESLLKRRPATLSGGEQQRVAIARTLAARPGVILYDEPLANLDPDRRTTLRRLIRRLAREHKTTLVYVTHDPAEALEIGDEVVVMSRGRVVERGAPQELYRRPRTLEGARALGPVSAVGGSWRDGVIDTPLGVLSAAAGIETATSGACTALFRPEAIRVDGGGRAEVRIEDVVACAHDWTFSGMLGDVQIHGHSQEPVQVGETVRVRAEGPVAVVSLARDLHAEGVA